MQILQLTPDPLIKKLEVGPIISVSIYFPGDSHCTDGFRLQELKGTSKLKEVAVMVEGVT
jgi:hypothetical protein